MALEISCEAAVDGKPSEGSLDDPSHGENLEAPCLIGPLDDLDGSRRRLSDDRTGITAVANDHLQEGKACRQVLEQPCRAIAILDAGGMDIGLEEKTQGVGEDVALASLDLLSGIITDCITGVWTRFDRLAVDDGRAWLVRAAFQVAAIDVQRIMDARPGAIFPEAPEILSTAE